MPRPKKNETDSQPANPFQIRFLNIVPPTSGFPWWAWGAFLALIAVLLTIDLWLLRASQRSPKPGRALAGCLVFIAVSLAFGGVVWRFRGSEAAQQYLAAYLIELALSADNLFVFMLVFERFGVGPEHQHRVLFWGIVGAMVMRALFVLAGVTVIQRFHWVLFIFGFFLVFMGAKMALGRKRDQAAIEDGAIARFFRRLIGARPCEGPQFFIVERGRRVPTILFLVLLIVETTDLVFALDSIPAVLAVATSGFVAITSNIFAVLSLRSLYLVLNGVIPIFRHLKAALAVILVFIGAKMLLAPWIEISTTAALGVIGAILAAAALLQKWPARESSPRSN